MTTHREEARAAQSRAQASVDDAVEALRLAMPKNDPSHAEAVIDDVIATLNSAKAALANYRTHRDADLRERQDRARS